jgi:hypothetical protein
MDVSGDAGRYASMFLLRWWAVVERGIARIVIGRLGSAASRDDPASAARWLRRAVRDVSSGTGRLEGRRPRRRLPRIAILARSQFTDDAREIARRLGVDRVLLIRREAFKALAAPILPPDVGDLTYRASLAGAPERMAAYQRFLVQVWRRFDPAGDVELVLTANTCYWAEVELGAALGQHGVAFVALHKENLKSPGHQSMWEPVYRSQRAAFLGERVLVQTEGERSLQIRGEVTSPERIEVVGFARLDGFHAHRRSTAGERIAGDLLFASFLPGAILPRPHGFTGREPILGLPVPEGEPRPEDLVDACFALHRVAVHVARRLPSRRVVVKTKGAEGDRHWVPRILEYVAGVEGVPSNVDVIHGGDAAALTKTAGVVAGLNTTVLLEAIAAGRPAVSLALGEAAGPAESFVIDLEGAAEIVTEQTAAIETVVRLASETHIVAATLPPATLSVLRRWADNTDGTATERTVASLRRILELRQETVTQLSTTRPSTRAAKRPE